MHIENMIKAVRGMRGRILDSGIKLAVENHGGDPQAREMKTMIEAIGTDVMGVCLDSGNPVWMLEDPHMTLETLIPYAETSHVRDSAPQVTILHPHPDGGERLRATLDAPRRPSGPAVEIRPSSHRHAIVRRGTAGLTIRSTARFRPSGRAVSA